MRRSIVFFLAAAMLLCAGCAASPAESSVVDVTATPPGAVQPAANGEGYALQTATVFYPEGADESTAQYVVTCTLPVFDAAHAACNAAVELFQSELTDRVLNERLPLADRTEGQAVPYTTVTSEVRFAATPGGDYVNLIFTESWGFGPDEQELRQECEVLDAAGASCSFAAVSGVYEPAPLVAQQVFNILDREDGYYGDLIVADVQEALDLYSGFTVADEGYTVYFPAGALAEEERGVLEFSFGRNALYPDFVDDLISAEDYEAVLPSLYAIATACGPDFSSYAAGDPLPEPGELAYRATLEEARQEGDELILTGMLMSGTPGSPTAAAVAPVTVVLGRGSNGYEVRSFEVR